MLHLNYKIKYKYRALLIAFALLYGPALLAQDSLSHKVLTLPQVVTLAVNNSVQLKVGDKNTELARQKIEINKLYKLPTIYSSGIYGYISNADIWSPSFSDHETGHIPHQEVNLSVLAAEVIFKGGEISNTLKQSSLEEQVAALAQEKNTEDIKFLVVAQYLDIFRYTNLRQVYVNNAILAEHRLANILSLEKQGLVTQNDVLRTKLTLSDFQLAILKTDNTIAILNKQLNMVTGRSDSARLVPDSTLLTYQVPDRNLASFIEQGYQENHELKIAATENRIAETNIKILGSDRYPQISLFSGSSLQRPFLFNIPAIDLYYNIWQAGISVTYNISSIYQSPRKIRAGKIALEQSLQEEILKKQNMEVDVGSRYIKYTEAKDELRTCRNDLKSAEENYRIVEKKYFNQLALLTDLIDATSTKIEAETKVTNAEINTVYSYFLLQKAIGNFKF
jgi:outer membrane protein